MPPALLLPCYILAGGRSRRFGSDKARALLHGQPLISRIAAALDPVAVRITVVADRPAKYDDLGLRTIADVQPDGGPMIGLKSALLDLHDDEYWLLLASCDLVTLQTAWIEKLCTARTPDVDAVAFAPEDRWQPLLALYQRSCLPVIDGQLAKGDRAMWRLLNTLKATAAPTPADWPTLVQVNTPEELARRERNTSV